MNFKYLGRDFQHTIFKFYIFSDISPFSAEPIFVYNIEVEDAHTYFVSDSEILVYNKSEKMLHWGKYSVSNTEFHGLGGMKENILKKAGKNPDIKVLADGSITLHGTGSFKGKSMKTDLKIETFFEDD